MQRCCYQLVTVDNVKLKICYAENNRDYEYLLLQYIQPAKIYIYSRNVKSTQINSHIVKNFDFNSCIFIFLTQFRTITNASKYNTYQIFRFSAYANARQMT